MAEEEFWDRYAEALWMEKRYREQMTAAANAAIAAAFGGG